MGVRPDGKPDRRHRTGATEAEVTSIRQDLDAEAWLTCGNAS